MIAAIYARKSAEQNIPESASPSRGWCHGCPAQALPSPAVVLRIGKRLELP
jgi:hypothetical protein